MIKLNVIYERPFHYDVEPLTFPSFRPSCALSIRNCCTSFDTLYEKSFDDFCSSSTYSRVGEKGSLGPDIQTCNRFLELELIFDCSLFKYREISYNHLKFQFDLLSNCPQLNPSLKKSSLFEKVGYKNYVILPEYISTYLLVHAN